MNNTNFLGKVIIIGDCNTGKTSLFDKMIGKGYCENTPSTIGVDFHSLRINIEDISIKLQIWDAAGQEKFRKIVQNFYKNLSVAILVFDQYNRDSFLNLEHWISEIQNANDNKYGFPLFFLVGNKNDLEKSRLIKPISDEEIDLLVKKHSITSYHSLSAKLDDKLIETLMNHIAQKLYNHTVITREKENVELNLYIKNTVFKDTLQIDHKDNYNSCCNLL